MEKKEHKKLISEKIKELWKNPLYRDNFKIKLSITANKQENKIKKSNKLKELWNDEERREIIRNKITGLKRSDSTKEKLRIANKNKIVSKETAVKISESLKEYYKNKPKKVTKYIKKKKIKLPSYNVKRKPGRIKGFKNSEVTKKKIRDKISSLNEEISNKIKKLWDNDIEYRENLTKKIKMRCCKPVKCVNIETKKEMIFESSTAAAKFLNISKASITDVLKKRIKLTNKRYKFEYVSF